ncbi:hypothetical protein F2Q69_00004912 [Brassica cretica]|uniref:Uncharacterized protein n=1 Tax=Brassica cretica TaxID=69181 RepID=A0A8S9NYA9_BRACR|nr:hypothetical protein F2Q69_00004912 [Brassica cretica]
MHFSFLFALHKSLSGVGVSIGVLGAGNESDLRHLLQTKRRQRDIPQRGSTPALSDASWSTNFEARAGSGSEVINPRAIWSNEAESRSDLSERGEAPALEAERPGGATSSTRAQYQEMKQRAGATSRSVVRHPLWKQSDLNSRHFIARKVFDEMSEPTHQALSLPYQRDLMLGEFGSTNDLVATMIMIDGLESQEELCFVNANETCYKKEPKFQYHNNYQQKPFYNNQQGGYQSTQGQVGSSTSAPQESSTNTMLKQILESQNNTAKSIRDQLKILHTKIDGNYNDLNNKFLQLSSHFKALENQFASMPSTSKRPMGSLPGKSEQNPKDYCNVILSTTSFEIELRDHEKEVDQIENLSYRT